MSASACLFTGPPTCRWTGIRSTVEKTMCNARTYLERDMEREKWKENVSKQCSHPLHAGYLSPSRPSYPSFFLHARIFTCLVPIPVLLTIHNYVIFTSQKNWFFVGYC
jgi:hypothetical protein